MITNDFQYNLTKKSLQSFASCLAQMGEDAIGSISYEACKSEYDSLKSQLEEYEAIKSGIMNCDPSCFKELPELLIKIRIFKKLSQKGLADKLGMRHQQIQRYEANLYAGASFTTLIRVINALEVDLKVFTIFKSFPQPLSI